jgi:hypothetical protein
MNTSIHEYLGLGLGIREEPFPRREEGERRSSLNRSAKGTLFAFRGEGESFFSKPSRHPRTRTTWLTSHTRAKTFSGARRLCVTSASEVERQKERKKEEPQKKRRKLTFFPGPSNVT